MDDKHLRQAAVDALDWDPSIESAHMGVAARDGVITLSGQVPNYAQKLEAESVTKNVRGVKAIAEEIEVRYPGDTYPTDEEIAAQAAEALKGDVLLPLDRVKVKVTRGWATLSGELEWDCQRRSAESDVHKLNDVVGVINQIELKRRELPQDIHTRIEDAFKRDAGLDAAAVTVEVSDGKVTLRGSVHTRRERDLAAKAAWSAPGVRAVEDLVAIA